MSHFEKKEMVSHICYVVSLWLLSLLGVNVISSHMLIASLTSYRNPTRMYLTLCGETNIFRNKPIKVIDKGTCMDYIIVQTFLLWLSPSRFEMLIHTLFYLFSMGHAARSCFIHQLLGDDDEHAIHTRINNTSTL